MNIYVKNIRVESISNVGSFNVGKVILCQNRASVTNFAGPTEDQVDAQAIEQGHLVPPSQIQTPQVQVPQVQAPQVQAPVNGPEPRGNPNHAD